MDKTLVHPGSFAHCFNVANMTGPEYASDLMQHLVFADKTPLGVACGDSTHTLCHDEEVCPGHELCHWHQYYCNAARGWCADCREQRERAKTDQSIDTGGFRQL